MAVNRGVTLFVLLLYCCHKAEQPINTPSDEILVQEIVNPNKSSKNETPKSAATQSTIVKEKSSVEKHKVGSERYHELSDNPQLSLGSEKIVSNESSVNGSYHVSGSEDNEKKDSKNYPYESVSVLDKILKKIGKYSENLSEKSEKTSKAPKAESGQLREISVKNEILTE